VFVGGYTCGGCGRLFVGNEPEAIREVWRGANPERVGLMECEWCNGYGSSFSEDADTCTRCDGSGLVPMTWRHRITWTQAGVPGGAEIDCAP
jgi:hypothetical protein